MLGNIFRLAMLAGTGAGMAAGVRRVVVRLACLLVVGMIIALLVAAAIGCFGFAVYLALAPAYGPAWGAVGGGALLIVLVGVILGICRYCYMRRTRTVAPGPDLGGSLGAAALGASVGAMPNLDIRGMLERNAVTVLLTAFIAGMVMNNRRR
jgi:hypothetical protein